jgi:hypothetical protein
MDSNQKPKVKENLTKAKKSKEERDAAAVADQLERYVAKTGICFDPNRGRYYLRDSRGVWVGYSDRHVDDILARYGVPLEAESDRKDVATAAHRPSILGSTALLTWQCRSAGGRADS